MREDGRWRAFPPMYLQDADHEDGKDTGFPRGGGVEARDDWNGYAYDVEIQKDVEGSLNDRIRDFFGTVDVGGYPFLAFSRSAVVST